MNLDLLIRDATILTGEAVIPDGFLGIHGDRIALVASGLPQGCSAKQEIRLPGRVVTPGFVNVHTHASLSMVRGVAEDMGFAPAYTRGVPNGADLTVDESCALARLGALEALCFGSTLINDSYVHAIHTAPVMAELGLRVYLSERIHDVDFSAVPDGQWLHRPEIGERTLRAACDLAERWNGVDHIGVQFTAHAPDTCSDELLTGIRDMAERHGVRVNTHLAQSRTEVARIRERSGLSPAQLLDRVGLLDQKLIAAHCLFLDEEDFDLVGRAGITVAHIPKGNATGGAMAPTDRLRRHGARIALGTDNMHGDMVEAMRWALCSGRLQQHGITGDWQPHTVFEMATAAGASAMGLGLETGCLKPGYKADFVAFDFRRPHLTPCLNPLGNLVHTAQGRDVDMVAVDGTIVVESGRPLRADVEEVCREAGLAAQSVWERCRR